MYWNMSLWLSLYVRTKCCHIFHKNQNGNEIIVGSDILNKFEYYELSYNPPIFDNCTIFVSFA